MMTGGGGIEDTIEDTDGIQTNRKRQRTAQINKLAIANPKQKYTQ